VTISLLAANILMGTTVSMILAIVDIVSDANPLPRHLHRQRQAHRPPGVKITCHSRCIP
jgi:hypothetical protein